MSRRSIVMLGMILGSGIGGFVPAIWGAGYFSYSGLIFSALGGFLGIFVAYKLTS